HYRLGIAAIAAAGLIVIGAGPHAGLFVGPWWTRAICALGVGVIALLLGLMRRPGGIAWYHAFVLPLGAFACMGALVRSAALAMSRRRIRGRDHHYPREERRAHARQRNDWAREVWRSTR